MEFRNATCEVCRQLITDIDTLVAYRLVCPESECRCRIERVNLAGKQPGAGVRVVCVDCLAFFWGIWESRLPGHWSVSSQPNSDEVIG